MSQTDKSPAIKTDDDWKRELTPSSIECYGSMAPSAPAPVR